MIITRIIDFPDNKADSFVVADANGDYNIYLNAKASREDQYKGYIHELKHLLRGDFDKFDVQSIESEVRICPQP